MTLHSIIDQFDLLLDAPDSVPKLRQFILQFAVQGRLTEQDPSDEPASSLVERSKEEIKQLYNDGKITRPSKRPEVESEEKVFDIPNGWTWTRLGNVLALVNGRAYKQEELLDEGTPVMRIQNLGGGGSWYYSDLDLPPEKYCHPGDLLYAWSGTFGPYIWDGPKAIFHYHIWRIELTEAITKKYAYHLLQAVSADVEDDAHGIMLPHMTKGGMEKLAIPLPPCEEQQRIVATVDRLMDACDTLEAQQDAAEQVRVRCTEAATHALQTADTSAAVRTAWHRLRDHFDVLCATPDDIDAVRQTILQLAVQGKLTEQDPSDEPAEKLLERTEAEKERLKAAGDHKYQKKMPPITESDVPFSFPCPTGWAWVRFGSLGKIYGGGTPKKSNSEYWSGDIPWVSPKDMDVDVVRDTQDKISDLGVAESSAKPVPPGSVLIVGRSGILQRKLPVAINAVECTVNQDLKVLTPYVAGTERYIQLMLRGFQPFILDQLVKTGTTVESLKYTEFQLQPYPIPPLKEQQRIVVTVDRLMAACDALEAQLERRQALGAELLDAVLHTAVQGDGQPAAEEAVTVG